MSKLFEITGDDVAQLHDDADLRTSRLLLKKEMKALSNF